MSSSSSSSPLEETLLSPLLIEPDSPSLLSPSRDRSGDASHSSSSLRPHLPYLSNGANRLSGTSTKTSNRNRHPRSPSSSFSNVHHYSAFSCYCFTVNYILGVGVLGMPHAFVKAGGVLSITCLAVVTLMAILTAWWLHLVGQAALRIFPHSSPLSPAPLSARLQPQTVQSESDNDTINDDNDNEEERASDRKMEVNELVELFIGKRTRRVYEALLTVYIIGALWSYAAVFAQSMAEQVPLANLLGSQPYLPYLALFAFIVVPLTCLEMTELKPLAIALAIFRFVSLGLMMLTATINLFSFPSADLMKLQVPAEPHAPYLSNMKAVIFSGLALTFPVAIYAQIFHHSVPGLSHPLKDKKSVPRVFTAVLLTTFSLYCGLGVLVGLYFGTAVSDVATLNWSDYTGTESLNKETRSWLASFISYTIVLFPPIDIVSAFPLNAITLANNIMASCIPIELTRKRSYVIPFRLAAALLPLIGASLVSSLSTILNYTGCVGVMIAFLFPTVLWHYSNKLQAANTLDNPDDHIQKVRGFERFVFSQAAKYLVGGFSVVGLVAVIILSFVPGS